jgi:predicted NBD/HSP70 family sugar kinase
MASMVTYLSEAVKIALMEREWHRRISRLRILDALRAGALSRADVARATGLSRPMVSHLVNELVASGLLDEDAERVRPHGERRGRPATRLRLAASAGAVLGVELDHASLRVAVSDLGLAIQAERVDALDADEPARAGLDRAAAMAEAVLADAGVDRRRVVGVGLTLPGTIAQPGGVVGPSSTLPRWSGVAAAAELSRRLGLPVMADNDANLGAVGEAAFGAGRRAQDLIYVKVTSGIGAGVIVKGGLYRGAAGRAGELGHVRVRPDGPLCRCGRRGCLETFASTDALRRALPGRDLRAILAGDAESRRAIAEAGRMLGSAVAALLNVLNPELVVIGGDLAPVGETLVAAVGEAIADGALPEHAADARVVTAGLGERAQLYGALGLVVADAQRPS